MRNTLIYFLVLAGFIRAGDCIHCYVCDSRSNPHCGDPVNRTHLHQTECSLQAMGEAAGAPRLGLQNIANEAQGLNINFACMKLDAKDSTGKRGTVRSCMFAKTDTMDPCNMVDVTTKMFGVKFTMDFCGVCNEDLCNGSNMPFFSTTLLFLTVSSALFISY
ncbi:UPAR/Ly6 domain-containing protein CG9338-like [Periplaneta americana]|uniref:UPAR/Ly6 domain-containing protein CG9338-like n=1 Tax=Periplaneta americana TaxID=6978 RepID=UPI0037E78BEA